MDRLHRDLNCSCTLGLKSIIWVSEVVLLTLTLSRYMALAWPSLLSRLPGSSLPLTRAVLVPLSHIYLHFFQGLGLTPTYLSGLTCLSLPTHFQPFFKNMVWFLQSPCLTVDQTIYLKFPSFVAPQFFTESSIRVLFLDFLASPKWWWWWASPSLCWYNYLPSEFQADFYIFFPDNVDIFGHI